MDGWTAVLGVLVPASTYFVGRLQSRANKETSADKSHTDLQIAYENAGSQLAAAALNSLQQQIASLTVQVNAQATRLDTQSTTIEALRNTIESLRERVRVLEDEKRALLADHSQEKAHLEHEIETLRALLEEKNVAAMKRDQAIEHQRETQETLCSWIARHGITDGESIVIGGIEIALMAERRKGSDINGDVYEPVRQDTTPVPTRQQDALL